MTKHVGATVYGSSEPGEDPPSRPKAVKRSRPIANLVFVATFIDVRRVFAVACLRHN